MLITGVVRCAEHMGAAGFAMKGKGVSHNHVTRARLFGMVKCI